MSSEIAFNDDVLKTNVPGYSKRDFAKLRRKQISFRPLFLPDKSGPKGFPTQSVKHQKENGERNSLFQAF